MQGKPTDEKTNDNHGENQPHICMNFEDGLLMKSQVFIRNVDKVTDGTAGPGLMRCCNWRREGNEMGVCKQTMRVIHVFNHGW